MMGSKYFMTLVNHLSWRTDMIDLFPGFSIHMQKALQLWYGIDPFHQLTDSIHVQIGTLFGLGTPEQENTGYFEVITHEIRLLEIETKCHFWEKLSKEMMEVQERERELMSGYGYGKWLVSQAYTLPRIKTEYLVRDKKWKKFVTTKTTHRPVH